jgi:hypothetical protein
MSRKYFHVPFWNMCHRVFSSGLESQSMGWVGVYSQKEELIIQRVHTSPGIHPNSCNMGNGSYLFGSEASSRETTRSPPPSVNLKQTWFTSFVFHIPSCRGLHLSTWTTLPLPHQFRRTTKFLNLWSHTIAKIEIWYFHSVLYQNTEYVLFIVSLMLG